METKFDFIEAEVVENDTTEDTETSKELITVDDTELETDWEDEEESSGFLPGVLLGAGLTVGSLFGVKAIRRWREERAAKKEVHTEPWVTPIAEAVVETEESE